MGDRAKIASKALLRLRKRREELELSQADVAEKAGINPSYIGLLERGERVPSIKVLAAMAQALGMTLSEVFTAEQSKALPEVAAIASTLGAWPKEHRKAAVRVVAEMDRLLRARRSGS